MGLMGFRRRLAVWILVAGMPMLFAACSSSKPDDEGLEVENAAEEQNEATSEKEPADNNVNAVETAAGSEEVTNGGAVQDDLQGIISEMNNSPTEAAPAAVGEAVDAQVAAQNSSSNGLSGSANQGSGAMAAGVLPEMGAKMSYIVQPGDTLGKIANKIFGDSGKWKEIAELSNMANPSRIFPGDLVYYQLGESSVNFAKGYESIAKQEVTVKAGDTLAKIATKIYGDSRSWKTIWRLNDEVSNPDELVVGQTLVLISPEVFKTGLNSQKDTHSKTASIQTEETQVDNANSKAAILIANNSNTSGKIFNGIWVVSPTMQKVV